MSTAFVPTSLRKQDVISAEGGLFINCKSVSGKIFPALTPVKQSCAVPQNIVCVKYYPGLSAYIMYADGSVYSSMNGAMFIRAYTVASDTPFIVEERTEEKGLRGHVICNDVIFNHMGMTFNYSNFEGNLSCGAIWHGRLFGADRTDGYKLNWSGEGGVYDWTSGISGAGWAYPEEDGFGKILNVIGFNDRLVLLRQHGLTVVKAFGSPENFAMDGYYRLPNIIAGTAAVVGDKLFICTGNGLFYFTGSSVQRISDKLFSGLTPVNAVAFGDRYLACGNHSSFGRNVIYVYDSSDKTSYIADAPVAVLCAAAGVFGYDSSVCYLLAEGGAYTFISGAVDFGTDKPKVLEKIYIDCAGNVGVTVSNGQISRKFVEASGTLRLNMRGSAFTFTVTGKDEIRGITAYAEADNAV